jgi:serine/threonine protein kinase HipA of HipAB toxin-antitoxin module
MIAIAVTMNKYSYSFTQLKGTFIKNILNNYFGNFDRHHKNIYFGFVNRISESKFIN